VTIDASRDCTHRADSDSSNSAARLPLRAIALACGCCSAALFIIVGLAFNLQWYGDGSIFSYAVAAQDAWVFHWHNLPGRMFVYLFAHLPAESYVAITQDPFGGVTLYGLLFFAAPAIGLVVTFAADKSQQRTIFTYACASTACLCLLVFGFPTETWITHAVFWPTMALVYHAPAGLRGPAAVIVAFVALIFTHEGALILAATLLASIALTHGPRHDLFVQATGATILVLALWAVAKIALPPDDYIASALHRAASMLIDPRRLAASEILVLLVAALTAYAALLTALHRVLPDTANIVSAALVALALAAYWLWFDQALHAENRYYLRTVVLMVLPVFGICAALSAQSAEQKPSNRPLFLERLTNGLGDPRAASAVAGAIVLIMLIHLVETTKFVIAWDRYRTAVRTLATGTLSDPDLGDRRFVSSARIGADTGRLAWSSTTPFLSVLLAPGFKPARLVVDPAAGYFWLACATASSNEAAVKAVPVETRHLVRLHACLHRG
jgi:hypothetical protein